MLNNPEANEWTEWALIYERANILIEKHARNKSRFSSDYEADVGYEEA